MRQKRLVAAGLVALAIALGGMDVLGQTLVATPADAVRPRGEIVERMKQAVVYLDKASEKDLWSGFSETGMWGADWPGRTLEAYARVSLSLGAVCSPRFDEVGAGLLQHQADDGSFRTIFGKTDGYNEANADNKGNGFWFGNSRGLDGLIWAYRFTKEPKYLEAAKKLGDCFIAHYFDKDQPGAPGSFWWVATESLSELCRLTGERKYAEFAQRVAYTIPPANMQGQHTHSYLLAIRGLVQVHELLDDPELLNRAIAQQRLFKERIMWPGGGIVEHLGSREAYVPNYWFDENCSVDDWIGLNLDLWRLTRDSAYMDVVERTHLNHFYYDQDQSGGFCGDRGVDATRQGEPWPFCCAMHGTRTLSELTQYIATTDGADVYVNVFLPSATELTVKGQKVRVDLTTDYPRNGTLKLGVEPGSAVAFALKIRVPGWSRVEKLLVNGETFRRTLNGGYLAVTRDWKPGDTVEVELEMPLRAELRTHFFGDDASADYAMMSLWDGPRQLVYNQSLNNMLWDVAAARPALRFVYQTYEALQKDVSVRGTPLKIGAREYKKGLGTHAVSEIVVPLNGEFKEFISDIGIDACTAGKGAVRFRVGVDGSGRVGKQSNAGTGASDPGRVDALYGFTVSAMNGQAPAETVKVNVTGAKVLRLTVDDGVNGLDNDCADWADARLVRADGTVVYLSDLPDDAAQGMPWDWGVVELKRADGAATGGNAVTLQYRIGDKTYPIAFNYLADLGYTLMEDRPELHSFFRVDQGYLNAR